MRTRGSATAVALALTLTGCGVVTDVGSRDPSPTPTTSMPDILRKAAESLDRGPYSFQFRSPTSIGAGAVDGHNGWLRIRAVGNGIGEAHLTFEVLHADGQHLVRSDPLTNDQWTRLDMKKVGSAQRRSLEEFADPAHARELFAGIAAAEPAGERRYRGTLDLTRATNPAASRLVDQKHLRSLGPDQAARVPFEASVDSQGRLLGFQFTLPAAGGEPESPAEISYSGHGFKPDLSGPFKGRIGPAPASVYKIVSG